MSRGVVVIGWGAAGLAAAYAASARGARVTIVGAGPGATSFYSGAVDDIEWSEREAAASVLGERLSAGPLEEGVSAFVEAVTDWELAAAGSPLPRLAATSGIVRSARGRDRALLDLGTIWGRRVLVPRAPRAGWDADALVASLRDQDALGLVYEPIDAAVLRFADEARISDADLAARHDEDARLDWLAARIAPSIERYGRAGSAVLLGPWLGLVAGRAAALEARLGCPVGEAILTGSLVPGLRFEAARARWARASGVTLLTGTATALEITTSGARVHVEGHESIDADVAVLATGGLVGGGLVYEPPEHGAAPNGPQGARAPFRLTVDVADTRVSDGAAPGVASSIFGPVLDHAWPRLGAHGTLERAGVLADARGFCAPQVLAAGDVVAGSRHTVLGAVASGLSAGARAALNGAPPSLREGGRGGELAEESSLEARRADPSALG